MARNKGTFKFAATLEVKAAGALDPRVVVDTKAELVNKETWPYDGDTVYVYNGMQVAVVEEKAVYMLVDASKILEADYSGWERKDASAAEVVEVVDNLLSENSNAALSAKQGKVLDDKIAALSNKLTAIFKFKGSKANLDEIQAVENPETGDVYHNSDNGGEYVYDGTQWELLGLSIDLEPYAKTVDVTTAIEDAKTELSGTIDSVKTDLQSKIDTKVTAETGKSLIDDTLIDQIGQNKADIESLTTNLESKANQSDLEEVSTKVTSLTANLEDYKVKDVNTTDSNGVQLGLSDDGKVTITVNPTNLKSNLNLSTSDVKLAANIGGTDETPIYAKDSSVQAILSDMYTKIKSNTESISAAVAGGVTAIAPGLGIDVDTKSEGTSVTKPKVSVKINPDSNLRVTEAGGLDLVWLE